MTGNGLLQIIFYLMVLVLCVKPLGAYMARVYENKSIRLTKILGPIEKFIYQFCSIDHEKEMNWKQYLSAMLVFNLIGMLAVYAIQRLQIYLPLNPQHFPSVTADLAFNTASSFVTNTNWQAYAGESSLAYLTQMLGLTVQNFLSAATGMSLMIALIRGIQRHEAETLGNFWVDTTRGILYIYLPLATLFAIILASQGVIQNFSAYKKINLLEPITYQQEVTDNLGHAQTKSITLTQQTLPMGPVASQIAIKQLGSNGGGFFNTNSAHPFENPTPLSNFLEMLAILLIPAALCYTFGTMVKDTRQGWAIFIAMLVMFVPMVLITVMAEQHGNPLLDNLGVEQSHVRHLFSGGNMEGKEIRFGVVNSALWSVATTATSNGSVNSMLDSYTPLGGLVPLWMMHLGEVVFGGVGSGIYGMLMIIIITVFIAGLMVGRTPEYLGKKIEPYEMKMAVFAVLLMPMVVLIITAVGVVTQYGLSSLGNPGAHGFTEILYAFTSMGNNNGSAFAGLNANTTFYNTLGGIEMLLVRYWIAIPVLAIAGSLIQKKSAPVNLGTLPTHTWLFIILIIGTTIILGALTFFPALALGPIVEHFMLWSHHGH